MPKKSKRKCFTRSKCHKYALKNAPVPALNAIVSRELSDGTSGGVHVNVNDNDNPLNENTTIGVHSGLITALPNSDTPSEFDMNGVMVEDCVGVAATHISDSVEGESTVSVEKSVQSPCGSNICSTDLLVEEVTDPARNVCYSTGEELILDDILSMAQGLGAADNRYGILLVGVPESTKPPEEVQSVMSKWKDVDEILKPLLPLHIKTHIENDSLSILSLSRSAIKVIQRMLLFKPDGVLEVYVHGKLVKNHHPIYTKVGPLPSIRKMSAKVASNKVQSVIKIMRDFQTCMGASDKKYEKMWATYPGAFIEDGFQEYRYQKTLRPYDCDYLVGQRILRCAFCSNVQRNLFKKLKRAALVDEDAIPQKKPKSSKRETHINEDVISPDELSSCKRTVPVVKDRNPSKKKPISNSSGKMKRPKKKQETNSHQKLDHDSQEVGLSGDACPVGISLFDTLV